VIVAKAAIQNTTLQQCHSGEACPSEGWGPESRERTSMTYYLYILASKRNGTLYVGVINNLIRRAY
jgi:hypothetical protein